MEDHPEEINRSKKYQDAQENYALVIGQGDYSIDKKFKSLHRVKNDVKAIKSFLL